MLSQIHLQNFESHKDTIIDLHNGTNAIIGESDSGKSAILRALYWVVFNRPLGDDFRSFWGGDTSVKVTTSEGHEVIRIKGDKKNEYEIFNAVDKTNKKLSNTQFIVEDIAKVLGLHNLNFQTQFDPHYLLPPVSSGEVARKLNEIVDLTIIDTSQYNINNALNSAKKEYENINQDIKKLQENKKELIWIKYAHQDLKEIEELNNQYVCAQRKEEKITKVLYDMKETQLKIDKYQYLENAKKEYLLLKKEHEKHIEDQVMLKQITILLDSLTRIKKEINILKTRLADKKEELKRKFPKECPLCGSIKK